MAATVNTSETLESVVAALSAEEAKERLLDLLRKDSEAARELIREKCEYRPDEKENAYLESLRASLGRVIDELAGSIDGDEFTPYWDELSLTDENDYLDEMSDLFCKAARKMPLEALLQVAVETDGIVRERTVFDWHPDPTESLTELLRGVGIGVVRAAPEEENEAALETIEKRFRDLLSESEIEYVMGSIREAIGQVQKAGRGPR